MKPNVGMNYPVAAGISSYTPYSGVTYGTGFVVSEARGANLQWQAENGEFYGDDVLLDTSKKVTGYTLDFESTGLADDVRVKLLGEVKDSTSQELTITGAESPDVGFGYIKRMRDNSSGTVTETFEAWWFWKIKFGQPSEEARTKEGSIEWRTPTMNGTGMGVFQDSDAADPDFATHKTFSSMSAAKTWLNTMANISAATT